MSSSKSDSSETLTDPYASSYNYSSENHDGNNEAKRFTFKPPRDEQQAQPTSTSADSSLKTDKSQHPLVRLNNLLHGSSSTKGPEKSPEERSIDSSERRKYISQLLFSMPFALWMSRTLTVPSNVYHQVWLRGTILKYRPWKSVSFLGSLLIVFGVAMAQIQLVDMASLNRTVKAYSTLDTERGREVRSILKEMGTYEKMVPEDVRRRLEESHAYVHPESV
eukprot:CAMPEP_0117439252 /NCGR_PEP_ID=MMETSP0759-20121206/2471_1 /TAXON_ID=63605 /ORGANISM="Percolomonas cosmopolitus, Strain WS" /LENGTH=220 /DNA_ID=CAMNT_0005230965 /DNA_START=26 /DNA_END=688 /DNA_ORIENTATION=+